LGKVLSRGERLIELGFSWFSAKSILVERKIFLKIEKTSLGGKLS